MLPERGQEEPSLRDYLQVLRRRRLLLILTIAVVVGSAMSATYLQTPVYAASAEVLLESGNADSLFDSGTGQRRDPQRELQTEIRVLESQPVREAVRAKLGFAPRVSGAPAGDTDVIIVRGESTSPRRAAEIANAYSVAYIEFKRDQAVQDLLAAAQQIQVKIDDLQRQIDANPAAKDALTQQQILFKSKQDQLQVDAALKTGGAQLVTQAMEPSSPFRPKPLSNAILALVLGSLLGLVIAFVTDYFDDSIKGKADLERAIPGLPVVGLIPAVPSWKDRNVPQVISLTKPNSPVSEAYRTLRTSVQFLGLDRPMASLQLTSASAQEGKTTTLANLGVALARAGQDVVLVCCDLRRPRIHEFFGLSNEVGLTSVLLGDVPISAALQKIPGIDRLHLLASGPLPPNPSELLSSKRTSEVFTSLQEHGLLLLDSPPSLPVTDALVLAKHVDATLLVSVAGSTTRKDVSRAVELLHQVGAPLVGAVLNGVRTEGKYGAEYRYYSGTYGTNGNGAANGDKAAKRRKVRTSEES